MKTRHIVYIAIFTTGLLINATSKADTCIAVWDTKDQLALQGLTIIGERTEAKLYRQWHRAKMNECNGGNAEQIMQDHYDNEAAHNVKGG